MQLRRFLRGAGSIRSDLSLVNFSILLGHGAMCLGWFSARVISLLEVISILNRYIERRNIIFRFSPCRLWKRCIFVWFLGVSYLWIFTLNKKYLWVEAYKIHIIFLSNLLLFKYSFCYSKIFHFYIKFSKIKTLYKLSCPKRPSTGFVGRICYL